jgi:type 1 glutamine amidotransferase
MNTAPVLALIGDRYHNPDFIRLNFNRLFAELGVPYEYTANYEWFGSEEATDAQLSGRSLLIVARDGLTFPDGYIGPEAYSHYVTRLMDGYPEGPSSTWVSEGFGRAVRRFVEAGGSLFAWHNSLSVATFSEDYREVGGGVYDGHPSERPFKIEVIDHDHPVTRGVRDFIVTDEQHFPIHDRSEGELLLRGVNIDGLTFDSPSGAVKGGTVSAAAWAHTVGQGRVLMSAVGHNLDALWKPDYWTFQKNAIRWLLREA